MCCDSRELEDCSSCGGRFPYSKLSSVPHLTTIAGKLGTVEGLYCRPCTRLFTPVATFDTFTDAKEHEGCD